MEKYKNLSGDSDINSYGIGENFIKIKFNDGNIYRYTNNSAGSANIHKMKILAAAGQGLNTFISKSVRNLYASKRG